MVSYRVSLRAAIKRRAIFRASLSGSRTLSRAWRICPWTYKAREKPPVDGCLLVYFIPMNAIDIYR